MLDDKELIKKELRLPDYEYQGRMFSAPSIIGLKIIKSLIRGIKGDKYPLVKDFQLIWEIQLGKKEYKIYVNELKEKNWIVITRYSKKGKKNGKKVFALVDRDYAVNYLTHCQREGIEEAFLPHHGQPHYDSSLERI